MAAAGSGVFFGGSSAIGSASERLGELSAGGVTGDADDASAERVG